VAKSHREEFDRVALVHLAELIRAAVRLSGNRDTADDLVQETYLHAWRAFHRFEPGTNCRAWLYKILYFNYSNRRRADLKHAQVPLDEVDDPGLSVEPITPDTLTAESIKDALASLPDAFRLAVILIDVEQLTYREAAEVMSVPVGTVMSRLDRGRKLSRIGLARQAAAHGLTAAGGRGEPR